MHLPVLYLSETRLASETTTLVHADVDRLLERAQRARKEAVRLSNDHRFIVTWLRMRPRCAVRRLPLLALKPFPHTGLLQYGCHIGHRFGAAELLEAQAEGVEKGVNVAIRMLNEQAEFARQMIEGARHAPLDNGLVYWERLLVQAEEQIETLWRLLEQRPVVRGETADADT